jgi:hypothetical protein
MMAGRFGMIRRHWLFSIVLLLGVVLRAVAWVAYQPALFYSDSVNYLANTDRLPNSAWHPPGYPFFLDPLLIGHHLAVVSAVQHLMVVADAVVIYLLLQRLGCGRFVAALACTPALLDAYQVQIEQYVLSEALFETLLVAAIAIAMWPGRDGVRQVSARRSAGVAVLLGLGVLVRLDAVGLVVPLFGWLFWSIWRARPANRARRAGGGSWAWRPVVAAMLAFALPVAFLIGLREDRGNGASINGMGPIWLYSRVAPFANCPHDDLPASERALCPTQPLGHRPGPIWFQDTSTAPEWRYLTLHPGHTAILEAFARRVIVHQPLGYARAVTADFDQQFRPTRARTPNGPEVVSWQFRLTLTPVDPTKPVPQQIVNEFGTGRARLNRALARDLRDYQRFGYLPGPVMAVLLLFGVGVLVVRRRHPLAPALLMLVLSGVVTVLIATATVLFSWRYMLPTLLLYPPAGAVAWVMVRTPTTPRAR